MAETVLLSGGSSETARSMIELGLA